MVEDGNPADSERCLAMLEPHVARYGATGAVFRRRLRDEGQPGRGGRSSASRTRCSTNKRGRAAADMTPRRGCMPGCGGPGRIRGRDLIPQAVLRTGAAATGAGSTASRPTCKQWCSTTTSRVRSGYGPPDGIDRSTAGECATLPVLLTPEGLFTDTTSYCATT